MNEKFYLTEEERKKIEEDLHDDLVAYMQIPALLEQLFRGTIVDDDRKKLMRYMDTLYLKMRRGAW